MASTYFFRNDGYLFHIANSGAIVSHIATEMDMIRPGISLYGYPPGEKDCHYKLNIYKYINFVTIVDAIYQPHIYVCMNILYPSAKRRVIS